MKTIKLLEDAVKKELTLEELGVNRTFYWAYRYSHEANTEVLDFDGVIWEQDVPAIVESLRRFKINRFTISSEMSGLTEIVWAFEKNGCCLIGMTEVNTRFDDWETGQRKRGPAFEIRVLTF